MNGSLALAMGAVIVMALCGTSAASEADGKSTTGVVEEAMGSSAGKDEKPWRPAGVFVSPDRLAELRKLVAAKAEPTWTAWLALKKEADSALEAEPHAPKSWYVPGYYRDAEGHRNAKNGLQDDANRSYTLALAWRMTDDERYVRAAIKLIDAWPQTVEEMSTKDDSTLSFSYHFPAMIFAADLLRDYKIGRAHV